MQESDPELRRFMKASAERAEEGEKNKLAERVNAHLDARADAFDQQLSAAGVKSAAVTPQSASGFFEKLSNALAQRRERS